MRLFDRFLLVAMVIVLVLAVASAFCDLGVLGDATPTPRYYPAATPWWATPSYQPWSTAIPEGG